MLVLQIACVAIEGGKEKAGRHPQHNDISYNA